MDSNDEKHERLISKLTESGGRFRVSGALNPILWLSAIVAGPCIGAIAWKGESPFIVTLVLCAVVGTALLSYLWLFAFDRDRLHSEEYLIRSRTLDLIEEKGSSKAVSAAGIKAISQTEFLSLPETKEIADQ